MFLPVPGFEPKSSVFLDSVLPARPQLQINGQYGQIHSGMEDHLQ